MECLMKVRGLKKEYVMGEVTVKALRGIDFEINQGEFIVILGPSGSGKSTILNIIGGIDSATEGEVIYRGESINNFTEKQLTNYRRKSVGFVFQFYNLIPNLTAWENISLASELSDNPLDIDKLLEDINLLSHKTHFPSQLSGGEQQRISIARAAVKNPDLLLCDEPTGALDYATGIHALKLLKTFNTEEKKTVIIITHNISIGDMADRVFHIKDGLIDKIIVNENPIPPEEVYW